MTKTQERPPRNAVIPEILEDDPRPDPADGGSAVEGSASGDSSTEAPEDEGEIPDLDE